MPEKINSRFKSQHLLIEAGEAAQCDMVVIETTLTCFLERLTKAPLVKGADFLEDGIIDSVNFMQLLSFIKTEFGIKITLSDFHTSNFRNIASLSQLIAGKLKCQKIQQ